MVQRHNGVRTDRYKLINYYELGEKELFDLEADPKEMKSVYNDPEYAEIIKEMKIDLKKQREIYEDTDVKYPIMQDIFNKYWD